MKPTSASMLAALVSSLLLALVLVSLPALARAQDGEIAEASRKPGGINPAEIDWRCSIMAGRLDRAYLNCAAFALEPTRNAAVEFLINNPPRARGPFQLYED